jgi:hypothetical protein
MQKMMRSTLALRRIASAIAPKQSLLRATSMAAQTAHYHTAPLITSSIQQTANNNSSRSFATAANNLGSILQREINEEDEAAAEFDGQMPPDLAELHSDIAAKWTILEGISGIGSGGGETGSGATVRLFKKSPGSNGAKIGVVFHCQDTEEDMPFDEDDFLAGNEQDDESEEEPSQAVRFGVTVSKGGKTVVLQCRCGGDGQISVESVTVRDGESEGVLTALAGGENLNAALYQGPEFSELAEDLQESFQEYVVKECGIDEDVAAFISMYADYREQVEYVTWMKTAIDILD